MWGKRKEITPPLCTNPRSRHPNRPVVRGRGIRMPPFPRKCHVDGSLPRRASHRRTSFHSIFARAVEKKNDRAEKVALADDRVECRYNNNDDTLSVLPKHMCHAMPLELPVTWRMILQEAIQSSKAHCSRPVVCSCRRWSVSMCMPALIHPMKCPAVIGYA